jgi:uncharacterized protein
MLNLLMLASDAAWWLAVRRLTKKAVWRTLATAFFGSQLVALLSLMCDLNWTPYVPEAVLVAVILWHFFGFAFGLGILMFLGGVRACGWLVQLVSARKIRHDRIALPADPVALPPPTSSALTRREFFGACAAIAPPLFTIGSTAVALAQLKNLRVRRFTLSIPTLPRQLNGVTIAHVSDIHVGRITTSRVLREMVNITNALQTDLVLMTGDLIDYEMSDLSEGISLIKAMESRHGLWTIEGNHDLIEDGGEFERRIKASGIPFLTDETAIATVRGFPVQFFGLRWLVGGGRTQDAIHTEQVRSFMRQREADAFPVLLAHHPHAFDAAAKAGLPLTLAGHTHGGQLMLDSQHGVGSAFFRYWSGLYTRGNSQMIVSNGVGNWFPIRINAPAEIVHITLRCANA